MTGEERALLIYLAREMSISLDTSSSVRIKIRDLLRKITETEPDKWR